MPAFFAAALQQIILLLKDRINNIFAVARINFAATLVDI